MTIIGPPASVPVSVVLCTYNRALIVPRTIDAVLAQDAAGPEVVVVNDGSTDETAAVLAEFVDPRVRVIHRTNGGLCAARNSGLAVARGKWIVFLDDDDVPRPGWLASLTAHADDERYGITCIGARLVDGSGRPIGQQPPADLGPAFENVHALYFPGTFAVRRDLIDAAGGYLDGLGASHQFELFLRLVATALERRLDIAVEHEALLDMYRRPPTDRPLVNPRLLYDGTRWVLARHPLRFDRDRKLKADFEAIVGTNAARLGDLRSARRYLGRSFRSDPLSLRRLGRFALSLVPALARQIWGTQKGWATHQSGEIGLYRQCSGERRERELFLPWGYRQNAPASSDAAGTPFWAEGVQSSDVRNQDPVYRLAARLVRRHRWTPVVDVGCGSAHKLVHRIGPVTQRFVGADQASAIALARSHFPTFEWVEGDISDDQFWSRLAPIKPRLVLCIDVIEHVENPVELLLRLRDLAGSEGRVLLSTPDRSRVERADLLGPPTNQRHIREWTRDELEMLVLSTGFRVDQARHLLPRRYSPTRTELNRTVYRALHLRPVPDARSSLALLLSAEET